MSLNNHDCLWTVPKWSYSSETFLTMLPLRYCFWSVYIMAHKQEESIIAFNKMFQKKRRLCKADHDFSHSREGVWPEWTSPWDLALCAGCVQHTRLPKCSRHVNQSHKSQILNIFSNAIKFKLKQCHKIQTATNNLIVLQSIVHMLLLSNVSSTIIIIIILNSPILNSFPA